MVRFVELCYENGQKVGADHDIYEDALRWF